jgi:hypothetical protein
MSAHAKLMTKGAQSQKSPWLATDTDTWMDSIIYASNV